MEAFDLNTHFKTFVKMKTHITGRDTSKRIGVRLFVTTYVEVTSKRQGAGSAMILGLFEPG